MLTNGRESAQVVADNSDLSDPTNFTIPVLVEDPALGGSGRAVGQLRCSGALVAVAKVVVGTGPGEKPVAIRPRPETKFTPIFPDLKDDGTTGVCTRDTLTWGEGGLGLFVDLLPPGDLAGRLTAVTMTGARAHARYEYKVAADQALVDARKAWDGFKSEAMVGEWEWVLPTDPPKPMGVTMAVAPTGRPFHYHATLRSAAAGPDRKPQALEGELLLRLRGQPFLHLLLPAPTSKAGMAAIIGPMA